MLIITVLFYSLAMIASICYAFYKKKKCRITSIINIILAVILHSFMIFLLYKELNVFPVFSVKYAIFMFAWSLGIGAILVSIFFRGTWSIIGFSTPLILLLIGISLLLKGTTKELSPVFNTDIFPIHVLLSIASYGLFALSFVSSVMYIFQESWLKQKRIMWLTKWLPSLFILDDLAYKTLTIGLPLLTLGIVTGALWANMVYGSYWNWDPKETWSLIIWFAYIFIIHARISLGWRGKKFAWASVICFLLVMFSFIGVNYIFKGYHNF